MLPGGSQYHMKHKNWGVGFSIDRRFEHREAAETPLFNFAEHCTLKLNRGSTKFALLSVGGGPLKEANKLNL